jgi:putative ABC transport system permease protein
MSSFRLLLASLVYHWRIHVAVGCGVAAGTAVLAGALLVGDSMRGSLRHLTLDRLGRIDQAMVTDRRFREQLAAELAAEPGLPKQSAVVPAILLDVSVQGAEGDAPAQANHVHLVGCDSRFWQLGPVGPVASPQGREIVLNRPLADDLGVEAGDAVLVRLPHLSSIPADTPLGRKSETVRGQRLTVSGVIPAHGLGGFGLRAGQQTPRNAYVPLDWLQERLDQPGRVNALLVADAAEPVQGLLRPTLDDYGIRVERTRRGYVNVTSNRMLLEPAVERAAMQIRKADLSPPLSVDPQPAFTYLANTIACGPREIPYSTITAVDFVDQPPLGPMPAPSGKPVARLSPISPLARAGEGPGVRAAGPESASQLSADGEIALNSWAAEDLRAKIGDKIRVTYFEPESSRGAVREKSVELRLAAIIELAGAADDPDFTPDVPGVTDQLSIANWDPPFPFDARRVRPKDDAYWRAHRGAPKAFVSLAMGQRLWGSRFGQATSVRFAASDPAAVEQLRKAIHIDPAEMGFVFQPVKAQGLAASAGTTPFESLFLGFSFFLIIAAAMLVMLLFRLGVDHRATEIGILLAVGLRRRKVAGLLVGEGLVVAAFGSLAGLAVGIGYAALLIAGLHTWWLAAIVTPFLQLYVTWQSLAIGYASGLVIAMATITWSARRAGRNPPRRLLAGEVGTEQARLGAPRRRSAVFAWGSLLAASGLAVAATRLSDEAQAGAFFGAASLVLAACLTLVWRKLGSGATGPAVAAGRGNLLRLALRNAARSPMRSTLTIGLVAAASFLIVAISAFRVDPAAEKPSLASGNGGFALVGQTDQPIFYDLNSPDGREQIGFSAEDSRALDGTQVIPLRVRPGDDASCLNLYRPQQPRVLGLPQQFIDRGGFAWANAASPDELERLGGTPSAISPLPQAGEGPGVRALDTGVELATNPWKLLELDLAPDPDGVPRIPVVLEKTTAEYSLHLGTSMGQTYEIRDGSGRPLRLVVVGLLGASIFQGDLLVSEREFLKYFPDQSGYRFFAIQTPSADVEQLKNVERALERTLGDFGFVAETTSQRMAAFQAVENTYLSTFQSLGGLGLLLGTFGLAAVQLRSVLERRRELALLRATGLRRRTLAWMVTLENAILLSAGLACGVVSAAVAVLPHVWTPAASIPWAGLAGTLALVLGAGLLAGLAAVRSAVATPLLAALRGE